MLNQLLEILKKTNVFLTGRGGVGKSPLTQAVIKHYKSELKNVVVLGSTGIAAVNVGGVSVHSFFKFGKFLPRHNACPFTGRGRFK